MKVFLLVSSITLVKHIRGSLELACYKCHNKFKIECDDKL